MLTKLKKALSLDKTVDNLQGTVNKIQKVGTALTECVRDLQANTNELVQLLKSKKGIHTSHISQSGFYATPAKRNVLFLHNSYYHFYYLSQALRRRGWDAITVSLEDPASSSYLYYHGEDINLFSPDPDQRDRNIQSFFNLAKERYNLLHVANDHVLSFFPANWYADEPADIMEWKNLGKKVAYSVSGCSSGISQTSIYEWTQAQGQPVCDTCIWKNKPDVCSDQRNLAWGQKFDRLCDIVFSEELPALDYLNTGKVVREPTTFCLDPVVWHPHLEVPEEYLIPRENDEILIYHAVGNYDLRSDKGKNIKGTGAILAAIDQLKAEGFPVRLIFVTNQRNMEIRYAQVQADIMVDQLNFGRYGATAREGMMLGKPTISYLNPHENNPDDALRCLTEIPLISASEVSIYEVLKDLVQDRTKREAIGKASREYALKWHSADACAERYEFLYDNLMKGTVGPYPEQWNYFDPIHYKASLSPQREPFAELSH